MSLILESKRAQAGMELQSHINAIKHHKDQIALCQSKISDIKNNFPEDLEEINLLLAEIK